MFVWGDITFFYSFLALLIYFPLFRFSSMLSSFLRNRVSLLSSATIFVDVAVSSHISMSSFMVLFVTVTKHRSYVHIFILQKNIDWDFNKDLENNGRT